VDSHIFTITKKDRAENSNQRPTLLWLTSSNKTIKLIIANKLEEILFKNGFKTYVINDEKIIIGVNSDLKIDSNVDKIEHLRRVAEISKLFLESNTLIISTFDSPFAKERNFIRHSVEYNEFFEIYIKAPVEQDDEISFEYQPPENPEIIVDMAKYNIDDSAMRIYQYLLLRGVIKLNNTKQEKKDPQNEEIETEYNNYISVNHF
jgi:adenylylsulfate kinase